MMVAVVLMDVFAWHVIYIDIRSRSRKDIAEVVCRYRQGCWCDIKDTAEEVQEQWRHWWWHGSYGNDGGSITVVIEMTVATAMAPVREIKNGASGHCRLICFQSELCVEI